MSYKLRSEFVLTYLPVTLEGCVWVIVQVLRKAYNLFSQTLNVNCTNQ